MRQIIHKLKTKPDHIKQMISLFTALAITAIIGALWILGLVFGGVTKNEEAGDKLTNSDGTPSPLTVIKDQFSDFTKTAGDQMAGVGSAYSEMIEQVSATSSTNVNQ